MNFRKLVHYALKCKFQKMWKGRDLKFFYEFMRSQAIPSQGFLLTLPLDEGGLAWFFYKLKVVSPSGEDEGGDEGLEILIEGPEVFIPNDATSSKAPEKFKGYPVWRLT